MVMLLSLSHLSDSIHSGLAICSSLPPPTFRLPRESNSSFFFSLKCIVVIKVDNDLVC